MNKENKPRVTIDTNLVISAMISPLSTPSKLLVLWAENKFDWIMTEDIFDEIQEVLTRDFIKTKYHINEDEIQSFINNAAIGVEFVTPMELAILPIRSRDPKDDKLLACALGGNCEYLITGDEDLLVLKDDEKLKKLHIIKAMEFLQKL